MNHEIMNLGNRLRLKNLIQTINSKKAAHHPRKKDKINTLRLSKMKKWPKLILKT